MSNNDLSRYEILRLLAVAGCHGQNLEETAKSALASASKLVGLDASAMFIWDEEMKTTLNISQADSEIGSEKLQALEETLFRTLRVDRSLVSAYLSFGGDAPVQSFTLPLRHGEKVFGAVIGLLLGSQKIVAEDAFLEALSSAFSLHAIVAGFLQIVPQELLDKEKLAAIVETAVTVNHEINNPLTAILGNVQLLLMNRKDLDDELRAKLKVIEESAGRIKEVTQRLMTLTTPRSVHYAEGSNMIDISGDEPEKE